jgi:2-polyprenyl-6-methoxyphenol hydroxylase-like FAD-dependent oxidoreductase
MEGFKRLFEQESLLVRWVRNRGMMQVAKHTLVKKQLIQQAMGLRQA